MVTVEADQVRVESRLAAGQVECPGCPGVLRPWGWARPRGVRGVAGALRPRRARCPGCLVTHVLLPVTVLLRRAYAAEVIWAGVAGPRGRSRVTGRIGLQLGVPAATVRGWLRVMGVPAGGGPGALRCWWPAGPGSTGRCRRRSGSPWRDVLAALGAATAAVTGRFGVFGVIGPVTAWQVLSACPAVVGCSHLAGRPAVAGCRFQHELPLTRRPVVRGSSRGSLPGRTPVGLVPLTTNRGIPW